MIKDVDLGQTICFKTGQSLSNLTTINYIYGPNGSGKTTISHALAAANDQPRSAIVSWEHGPRTIRVYNRDYVRGTFTSADGEEPGVFLLGSDSKELHDKIEEKEAEREKIEGKINDKNTVLQGKIDSLNKLRDDFTEVVWRRRLDIPEEIRQHMESMKGSRVNCRERVLSTADKYADRGTGFEDLIPKAETAFDESIQHRDKLNPSPTIPWNENDLQNQLASPIIGSADVPLSKLIDKLQLSDWVHEGIKHVEAQQSSEAVCPFCQQPLPQSLRTDLAKLFDDEYKTQISRVSEHLSVVGEHVAAVTKYRDAFGSTMSELRPDDDADRKFDVYLANLQTLQERIQRKLDNPAERVESVSVQSDHRALNDCVELVNHDIDAANGILDNRKAQKASIIDAAWREFARGLLSLEIANFAKERKPLEKAIDALKNGISSQEGQLRSVDSDLAILRRSTTSSAGAIETINELLTFCQFTNFRLSQAAGIVDGYRLLRNDGSVADVNTLSEGERTFITFLYYYHSLSAMKSETETERMVAVIDDPISSLDGDVMFVLSSLIRRLVKSVRESIHSRVDQVLVLTHNTRFHNEICYEHRGEESPHIKFYRIRKHSPMPSMIEDCGGRNPIRTAYQELWDEVANANEDVNASMPWLPNTMRRILETYFSTLGGKTNLYDLGSELTVSELAVHEALIAWSHSGSHSIMDADSYIQESFPNDVWLEAFERVFKRVQEGVHYGHYQMMMNQAMVHS